MRLIFLSLAAACAASLAARSAAPPPSEELLREFVRRLGDDDFETRREAAARLRGWAAAVPLLEEAILLGDVEARGAARELLRPFEARRARAACRRLSMFLAEGRFDLLPDLAVRWGPAETTEHCFQAASFAGNLCRSRAMTRAKGVPLEAVRDKLPSSGIPLYPWGSPARRGTPWRTEISNVIDTRLGYKAQFAADSIRVNGCSGIFLVGELTCYDGSVSSSIVIASGDVKVDSPGGSLRSIIICDGVVTLGGASRGIIIARKGIAITDVYSHGCVLVSGGTVTMPAKARKKQFIHEDAKCPLGLVRFFEVSDVGLTVDALAVKAVRPDCPLARAGLRKGDAFLSIDGVAVKDAEALRRALRKRYAIDGVGLFTLKRGDKTLTLRARLAD